MLSPVYCEYQGYLSKFNVLYPYSIEQSKMDDKAAALLGLKASCRDSLPRSISTKLPVQYCGYLYKKSFSFQASPFIKSKSSPLQFKLNLNQDTWNKRWFVIKDGFLLWYKSKPSGDALFAIHCSGCMPLGGCHVFPLGREDDNFLFELIEPDPSISAESASPNGVSSGKTALVLRSNHSKEVTDWMDMITQCSRISFQRLEVRAAERRQKRSTEENLKRESSDLLDAIKDIYMEIQSVDYEKIMLMEKLIQKKRATKKRIEEIDFEREYIETLCKELYIKLDEMNMESESIRGKCADREAEIQHISNQLETLEHLCHKHSKTGIEADERTVQEALVDIQHVKYFLE